MGGGREGRHLQQRQIQGVNGVRELQKTLEQLPLRLDDGVSQVGLRKRGGQLACRRLDHRLGGFGKNPLGLMPLAPCSCGRRGRPARLGGDQLDLDANQSGHPTGVFRSQRLVADLGDDRCGGPEAATRPSAVSRSKRAMVVRTANSNIGTASSTSARTAASPSDWRSSHGSLPPGATATNDCDIQRWSSLNAFIAAACPAWSPSKVKITRAGSRSASSRMIRRSTLMWSIPKAVPHDAPAVSTPARWQAMTSV